LIIDSDASGLHWFEHIDPTARLRFELMKTPESAIQRALEADLALIIVDLALPNLDGYDLYALIRSHEHTRGVPDVPVIALTERCTASERARTLSAGFFDHLTKPLQFDCIEDAYLRTIEMGPELHRNQCSVDRDSIIGQLVKALSWSSTDSGSAIAGVNLTLETFCADLLHRMLLARYSSKRHEAVSLANRLATLANDIGAEHLAHLCASILINLGGSEKQMERTVILAKAELDRISFSLREEAFDRGAVDKRPSKCKQ
jgi:CheY-like chemotaxis protein